MIILIYPTRVSGIIINGFIENSQEILLDFALQEHSEDILMDSPFLRHGIMAQIPWPLSQSNP